ncbi:MAG: response regulator [Spirochaetales bacterium]|nr:MAG: response regulator [Spirochaetales bacterium]
MNFKDVLIVDDSATSRMIIKRCFDIAGFHDLRYHEAEDGLKAISKLDERSVDLVVTDLKMPKMDGNTFLKKLRLREEGKAMPVIIISSMGNDVLESQFLEAGVMAIIRKPLSPSKLLEVLGEPNGQ